MAFFAHSASCWSSITSTSRDQANAEVGFSGFL
jgi:hypothetical protein